MTNIFNVCYISKQQKSCAFNCYWTCVFEIRWIVPDFWKFWERDYTIILDSAFKPRFWFGLTTICQCATPSSAWNSVKQSKTQLSDSNWEPSKSGRSCFIDAWFNYIPLTFLLIISGWRRKSAGIRNYNCKAAFQPPLCPLIALNPLGTSKFHRGRSTERPASISGRRFPTLIE